GSGGDELFGGYEHYSIMQKGERFLAPVPHPLRRVIPWSLDRVPASVLDRFFPYTSELGEAGMERFAEYVRHVDDRSQAYVDVNAMMVEGEVEEILGVEKVELAGRFERFFQERNLLDGLMTLEVNTQLPEKILMKADKTSMANSLELRMPLLNRGTVDLMAGLPSSYKVSGRKTKRVFRRAVKDVVPGHVNQRKKQRLFTPIHDWLREDMDWYVEEVLDEHRTPESPLESAYIEKARTGMDDSPLYYARQLWNVLNFEVWYDMFIAGDDISVPDKI
ncbi:MAG: asparagine synthase-related protein, partial [Candidatus Nanohaloarchaea archaeon]